MDLQPILENDLLKLRPLVAVDLEPLYAAANDPLIWDQHFDNRNERPAFEMFFQDALDSKGALVVVHKNSDTIIGTSRYFQYDGFPDGVEIGWTFLTREHWGGMYNKMMKELMINHALKSVSTVYLLIDRNNYRSQKAATKIGARLMRPDERKHHPKTRASNLIFLIEKSEWTG